MTTHLVRVVATAIVMFYSQGGLPAYIIMSIQHPNTSQLHAVWASTSWLALKQK